MSRHRTGYIQIMSHVTKIITVETKFISPSSEVMKNLLLCLILPYSIGG